MDCPNDRYVNDEAICQAFQRIDTARGETSLTYFEFGTLAALDIFGRESLDLVILAAEWGSGRRAGKLSNLHLGAVDPVNGGWGEAPKFPQAMSIEFLLREHLRTGAREPRLVAERTLDAMAAGGIYDHLGGGFARYATDAACRVSAFALGGELFVAGLLSGRARRLAVEGPVFDPRPDPTATRLAYVCGRQLRIGELDGSSRAIAGDDPREPDTVSWGSAEFVAANGGEAVNVAGGTMAWADAGFDTASGTNG